MSIFGFNTGEPWLFSTNYGDLNLLIKIALAFIFILYIIAFGIFIWQNIIKSSDRKNEIRILTTFVFLEGSTICCYALSSRVEMRNIYVPYVLLLIYEAYCISRIRVSIAYKTICLYFILGVSLLNNQQFQGTIDNLFFVRAMRLAKATYNNTIVLGDSLQDYKLYIEDNNELEWALMVGYEGVENGDIFYMYLDEEVSYDIIQLDDAELENKIISDLETYPKVRIIYINNNLETSVVDFNNKESINSQTIQFQR